MKRSFQFCFLLLVTAIAFITPARIITGTITDDAGNPIIAYIQVKGNQYGVSSGRDGGFKIQVDNDKTILIISAVGYERREIRVGKNDKLYVRLRLAVQEELNDVMITGDGTKQKKMQEVSAGIVSQSSAYNKYKPLTLEDRIITDRYSGRENANREGYDAIKENPFLAVKDNPLSTFSIDVDAASYSNVRRILKSGRLPDAGAVRIEEMINYFHYEYAQPTGRDPFSVHTELTACPWNSRHQLMLIGLQGKKIDVSKLPPSNLTFLIDVSGSMLSADKLPLVKASLQLLTEQLRPQDKVAIVVYAGNAGLVLPATGGENKIRIKEAIDQLEAGGSTAGGAGIQLAYKVANENFDHNGNNRVILCTDGDFNVGASSDDALENMIEKERKNGVFLTVLGFGTVNYQDAKMQKLADKGNGNHAYIDGIGEAKKVLINEFGGTLFTIAKDVKLQLEFNPLQVKGYRLIGYENRMLSKEDFNDDTKDAGELGSGHTVTALYELIPPGQDLPSNTTVDPLKYQQPKIFAGVKHTDEITTIKLRYKQPESDVSSVVSYPVSRKTVAPDQASDNLRFAASVASFGMLLRNSENKGSSNYLSVRSMASKALGKDGEGYRKEFMQLVDMAWKISRQKETAGLE